MKIIKKTKKKVVFNLLDNVATKIIMKINKETYLSKLSKELVITCSYSTKVIKKLEKCNIITLKKSGRKTFINLTNKGKIIQEKLNELKRII